MTIRRIIFCILTWALSAFSVRGQDADLGTWNILNLRYTIDKKWSVFGEGQIRSLRFYQDFHYYEYKGGVQFKAHTNLVLALGAGSYQTYKEGGSFVLPKNNDEFRIWPQILLTQSIGNWKIEQRYRAEFRFTQDGYRNRFRYRLGIGYPFGKMRNGYKPYQVGITDEIFFTNKEPYFERNRLQFYGQVRTSKHAQWMLGYLHQFDYRINDETGRDFLQIGCFIDLN
jgi:hypothetical protein